MKRNTYLDYESSRIQDYSRNGSYIINDELLLSKDYCILPDEYDIFSELDQSLFSNSATKQYLLISMCLRYMKECLYEFYTNNGIVCILPKMIFSIDNEGTIVFNMALSYFRAFLTFEGERECFDAYYGVVSQVDEESVVSETKKITINNLEDSIRSFLNIIVSNS